MEKNSPGNFLMFPTGFNSKAQQGGCCWGIERIPILLHSNHFFFFVLVSLISPLSKYFGCRWEISTKIFDYSTLSSLDFPTHTHTHTLHGPQKRTGIIFLLEIKNQHNATLKNEWLVRLDGNCGMKACTVFSRRVRLVYILLFFFLYIFDREREKKKEETSFFHFQPQRRTIKLWAVGLGWRQLKGGKNGPMRQAKIKAQRFLFLLARFSGIYSELRFVTFILRKLGCRKISKINSFQSSKKYAIVE